MSDELKMKRQSGTASGNYYEGMAATFGGDDHDQVILIAPSMEALVVWWAELHPDPLDTKRVVPVAVFHQKHLSTPDPIRDELADTLRKFLSEFGHGDGCKDGNCVCGLFAGEAALARHEKDLEAK